MSATAPTNAAGSQAPAIARRYETLIRTHRELEDRIGRETARPAVNSMAMQAMKRRKLRIKDAIAEIERSTHRAFVRSGEGSA